MFEKFSGGGGENFFCWGVEKFSVGGGKKFSGDG